ncbi:MAG: hypothetical protein KDD53_01340, partial [Bdellovibrionales bacterium]|nr:hypothetical protein [Bdellovibrionales bacterium]
MREVLAGVSLALVLLAAGCSGGAASSESGAGSDVEIVGDRSLAGGATTTTDRTSQAFENPASNLSSENLELHFAGDIDFGQSFVTAPAPIAPGLGPLFNNRSCESCHTKNGRGSPILGTGGLGSQALVRVSVAQGAAALPGAPSDVPGIGTQIQDHAIFGQIPEATIELTWKYFPGALPDGQSYELRSPVLKITLPNGTHLSGDVMTSLRMPQPVFGLGLLEAIPEDRLLSLTDPEDADNDGISGRANVVFDAIKGTFVLGRFGRKANQPTLIQQVASAYANDMGIGNPVFSDSEGNLDIDFSTLDSSTFYVQTLAVPRAIDVQKPEVKEGEGLFLKIGCGSCHVPSHLTGTHPI